jgi:hypothetical protein
VPKADLLFHQRIDYDDGAIVEMVLWRVASPVLCFTAVLASEKSGTTTNEAKVITGIFRAARSLTRLARWSN